MWLELPVVHNIVHEIRIYNHWLLLSGVETK